MNLNKPPSYPRIPHLIPERGTKDDKVLKPEQVAELLSGPVVVEEKLDGANVVLWEPRHSGFVIASPRGGAASMDRAGQLGPLRAWIGGHRDLAHTLRNGLCLYAEWLYLTHSVAYDNLPSLLCALDFRRSDGTFLSPDERNERATLAGLVVPPELWRGVPRALWKIEALLGQQSHFGHLPAEGLVVRSIDGSGPRIGKLLRPNFERLSDADWGRGRPHNALAEGASWR